MARLPDGWVFIPKMKDAITIELKQMELVTCRHCKHGHKYEFCVKCENAGNPGMFATYHRFDWFCADGEEEDAKM